jgi:hypothetical protein
MTATFGEFLTKAGVHIAGAVAFRGELPDSVRSESVGALGRLVAALARYLSDLPQPDDPGLTGPRCQTRRRRPPLKPGSRCAELPEAWGTAPPSHNTPTPWHGICPPLPPA